MDGGARRPGSLWAKAALLKRSQRVHWHVLLQQVQLRLSADAALAAAEREILKDVKRTFPGSAESAASEMSMRSVLIAFAHRNPHVGYCQSLNFVVGALLLNGMTEQDAFFSLCVLVEQVMPADYYSQELNILGARVDQLVFLDVLHRHHPALEAHLRAHSFPLSVVTVQWFMCLFAKDLPMPLTMRVWDLVFGHGNSALFAVALSLMTIAEADLFACATLETLYETLKSVRHKLSFGDDEAEQRHAAPRDTQPSCSTLHPHSLAVGDASLDLTSVLTTVMGRLLTRAQDYMSDTTFAHHVEIRRFHHRLRLQQKEDHREHSHLCEKPSLSDESSSSPDQPAQGSPQPTSPPFQTSEVEPPCSSSVSPDYLSDAEPPHLALHSLVGLDDEEDDDHFPWPLKSQLSTGQGDAEMVASLGLAPCPDDEEGNVSLVRSEICRSTEAVGIEIDAHSSAHCISNAMVARCVESAESKVLEYGDLTCLDSRAVGIGGENGPCLRALASEDEGAQVCGRAELGAMESRAEVCSAPSGSETGGDGLTFVTPSESGRDDWSDPEKFDVEGGSFKRTDFTDEKVALIFQGRDCAEPRILESEGGQDANSRSSDGRNRDPGCATVEDGIVSGCAVPKALASEREGDVDPVPLVSDGTLDPGPSALGGETGDDVRKLECGRLEDASQGVCEDAAPSACGDGEDSSPLPYERMLPWCAAPLKAARHLLNLGAATPEPKVEEQQIDIYISLALEELIRLQRRRRKLEDQRRSLRDAAHALGVALPRPDEGSSDCTTATREGGSSPLIYDAMLDIKRISDVLQTGWPFRFSPSLLELAAGSSDGNDDSSGLVREPRQGFKEDPVAHPLPCHDIVRRDRSSSTFSGLKASRAELQLQLASDCFPPDMVVLGVQGNHDVGKTFLLSCLCGGPLSADRLPTRGLSLRRAMVASMPVALLDCEGSLARAPLSQNVDPERQDTEEVLEELVVHAADYLMYVVDTYTLFEQRAVVRMSRLVREKKRGFRELVVVHNMRKACDVHVLQCEWARHVTALDAQGEQLQTTVSVPDRGGRTASLQQVTWYKTTDCRHVLLTQQWSEGGSALNAGTLALLRMWVLSIYIPVSREGPGLCEKLFLLSEKALEEKLERPLELIVEPSDDSTELFIRSRPPNSSGSSAPDTVLHTASAPDAIPSNLSLSNVTLPTAREALLALAEQAPSTDVGLSTGFVTTEVHSKSTSQAGAGPSRGMPSASVAGGPDFDSTALHVHETMQPPIRLVQQSIATHWQPAIDLFQSQMQFVVVIDLPGLNRCDIQISRKGACLTIRGSRQQPYTPPSNLMERSERQFGAFEASLEIPNRYLRKWDSCKLTNGVMRMSFPIDEDEEDIYP